MKKGIAVKLTLALLIIISVIICIFASGCKTTKHISSSVINKDSLAIESLKDSVSVLKKEVSKFEQLLKEYEYSSVIFDSTKCPKIIFPEAAALLNKDSVQRLVTDLNNAIEGLNNKVKIYADGSSEYTGRIKQINSEKGRLRQTIASFEKKVDSLQKKLAEKTTQITEKIEAKKSDIKRSGISIWPFVWTFIIGVALGIFVWWKFGSKIQSFFKTINKKVS